MVVIVGLPCRNNSDEEYHFEGENMKIKVEWCCLGMTEGENLYAPQDERGCWKGM